MFFNEVITMKKILLIVLCLVFLTGCGAPAKLPAPEVDTESQFGVDANINISNIDDWLGRDDAVYRDMRMLFDPADYAAIGGEADLTRTINQKGILPI